MRLSNTNLPHTYRLAREGNVFAKEQIKTLRIRLIQRFRHNRLFDTWCVWHKKRNGL